MVLQDVIGLLDWKWSKQMDLNVSINLGAGGHKDLHLTIPSMGVEVCADTYYVVVALENSGTRVDEDNVKRGVASLLGYWARKALACGNNEVIHLPFDFSDQYIGCLEVTRKGGIFLLAYGFSSIYGHSVNPIDPGLFCHRVTDFKATTESLFEVSRRGFVSDIEQTSSHIERNTALDALPKR